tara:strand:- start:319 stop:837 length:519 start_codon:yes stop_codon:yes gene_type:complete
MYNPESIRRGNNGEFGFVDILHREGFQFKEIKGKRQWEDHIDFLFWKGESEWSVDVKALKKMSRWDKEVNPDIIWVEFKNVRGNEGWLHGKATHIAFELVNEFIVVQTTDLAKLCDKIVDKKKRVSKAKEALYSLYTRKGQKDEISIIKLSDVQSLPHSLLQKEKESQSLPF